jgi:hypothetical protein
LFASFLGGGQDLEKADLEQTAGEGMDTWRELLGLSQLPQVSEGAFPDCTGNGLDRPMADRWSCEIFLWTGN